MAINIPIISDFDNKGIKKAEQAFAEIGKAGTKVSSSLKNALLPVGLAIGGLGAAMFSAAKDAVDYGETLNAVFVTFGKEGAQEIEKLAETSAKTYGLTKTDFNKMAVSFSSFAKKLATPNKKATKIVADLSQRVADFASVMNLEVPDAAAKFASALAGETEPMKKFGINISDAAIKLFALENNIGKVGGKLTEDQKSVARYGLLMKETSIYAGDFANTSDSLANQQKILKAEFNNVKIAIGTALLPIFQRLVKFISEQILPVIQKFVDAIGEKGLSQALKDSGKDLFEWVREAEGYTGAIIDLAGAVGLLVAAFKGFAGLSAAASAITTLSTGLGGLSAFGAGIGAAGLGALATVLGLLVINFAAFIGLLRDKESLGYAIAAIKDFTSLIANLFIVMANAIVDAANLAVKAANLLAPGTPFAEFGKIGYFDVNRTLNIQNGVPTVANPSNYKDVGVPSVTVNTGVGDPVAIGREVQRVLNQYGSRVGSQVG
jgi:hypothetical protein